MGGKKRKQVWKGATGVGPKRLKLAQSAWAVKSEPATPEVAAAGAAVSHVSEADPGGKRGGVDGEDGWRESLHIPSTVQRRLEMDCDGTESSPMRDHEAVVRVGRLADGVVG